MDFAAFYSFFRLEIHLLMVGIFDPACELLPPWTKELYLCTVAPLPSLWPTPPPPSQTKCTVYTDSVWLWGGVGVLNCVVDHILQEFYTLFLTRFRTYKIALPPPTKMTSKDDIYGLVSLKFLCPCPFWFIHKVFTYVEYRAVSDVFLTIDPPPPLHPASVSSPRTRGGGYTLARQWGGGGSIFQKTPDIGLASYSIIPLRIHQWVLLPSLCAGLIIIKLP
jgi:hypothetical protein